VLRQGAVRHPSRNGLVPIETIRKTRMSLAFLLSGSMVTLHPYFPSSKSCHDRIFLADHPGVVA